MQILSEKGYEHIQIWVLTASKAGGSLRLGGVASGYIHI